MQRNRLAGGKLRWNCSRFWENGMKCKSTLLTGPDNQLLEVSEHNHESNIPALIALLQHDEAIEYAVQNPSADPKQIFAEYENRDCQNVDIAMAKSSMKSFIKAVQRARAKNNAFTSQTD